MTPAQLLALADKLSTTLLYGDPIADILREYAARLTPVVSEEVVEKFSVAFDQSVTDQYDLPQAVGSVQRIFLRKIAIRKGLESVWPLGGEEAKDAARWREVLRRFDAQKTSACERIMADLMLKDSIALDLTAAIDAELKEKG